MTHTLCQHLVNTYCLNEYSKNLKLSEKQPEKMQLWSTFLSGKQKFCTSFSEKLLFLQKHKASNFYIKFKSRNVKLKSKNRQSAKEKNEKLQAHYFQSLKYTEQLAFQLNQSSPLWGSLYFSRHDLAFLNLRGLCSSLLKALHVCLFATLNNKRILFVGDPRPLVKEHQLKYQYCFISSQVKSLSTPMTSQLPPIFQYLQKKSNYHSFLQSLLCLSAKQKQQGPRARLFQSQENFSDPLNINRSVETDSKIERPETSKASLPEIQLKKSFQNSFWPVSKLATKAANFQTKLQSNKWMSEGFLVSLNNQPTKGPTAGKAKVKGLFKNAKACVQSKAAAKEAALEYLNQKLEHSNLTCTPPPTHAWVKEGFLQPYKSSKIDSLKRENLFILENQALAGQRDNTLCPLSTQTKQDPLKNSLEPLLKDYAATKFKQSPSKLLKKNIQLENSTSSPYQQNFKKHDTLLHCYPQSAKTKGPYDKANTKSSAQINESDLFYMTLTKLACKAAFRNSQWTAAFAQAEKGWKGGFFSNSLVSYKQNLTFSSKLNIQRVDDKDWLNLEIPFGSRAKLLYFSSKAEAGSYWNAIYLTVAKKKMIKKLENLNEFQGFKLKSQTRSKQSLLNFSGQIPAAKKLFKKPKLFGLRSFAYKRILTQVGKTEKAHFSLNPWLKEADLVFFANPEKSVALLSQVNRLRIPSIGIVNSGENLSFPFRSVKGSSLLSSNPSLTYPIIGNSNSLNFIKMVYAKLIGVLNKKVKLLRFKP